MNPITVGTLNRQVKSLLESTFERVLVEGELSRVTYHASGHVYFSLKDAESTVRCVLFRGNAAKLKFRLEQGMQVVADAALSVYVPRGEYQLNCFTISPAGEGALALAFEQLKKRLEAKGYFDPERKKPLPRFPKKIVLVTSATGAAVKDMERVAAKRWNAVKLVVIDTLVQGEAAAPEIVRNLRYADTLGADAVVVGRGGGSMEDLWAFNEEMVAETIYAMKTPVVSAVGHEIDYLISDFVADYRAPTPSAAMEALLPDRVEVMMALDALGERLREQMARHLRQKRERLLYEKSRLAAFGVSARLERTGKELENLRERFHLFRDRYLTEKSAAAAPLAQGYAHRKEWMLEQAAHLLETMKERMAAADPSRPYSKGMAQVVRDGKPVSVGALVPGEEARIVGPEHQALVLVKEVAPHALSN